MPSVYPSGAALATMSLPIVPPAPALLSTTTGWPSASDSACMAMRPVESVPPPGGSATMQRIGRVGQASLARTIEGKASAAVAAAPCTNTRRVVKAAPLLQRRARRRTAFKILRCEMRTLLGNEGDELRPVRPRGEGMRRTRRHRDRLVRRHHHLLV